MTGSVTIAPFQPPAGPATPLARVAAAWRAAVRPKRRIGPIGVEVGPQKLHMVQMEGLERAPQIRAAISLPFEGEREALLAEPARLAALVRRALRSRPFSGHQAVSCLPHGDVRLITVSYEQRTGQSEAEAIVGELRDQHRCDLQDSVVDYIPIRPEDLAATERSALVAVAPRARVTAYLDTLSAAGLAVEALDVGPAALARLIACAAQDERRANVLLLNFGREKSYLSAIWGRRLMMDREVEFGEQRLLARIGSTLSLGAADADAVLRRHGLLQPGEVASRTPQEAEIAQTLTDILRPAFTQLAAEINRTLIYVASRTRGQSIGQIYLLGSVARYPGVAGLLEALVTLPVEVFNPFTAFKARRNAAVLEELEPIAGIGVATGLALRGADTRG